MNFEEVLTHHIVDHPLALLFTVAGHAVYLTRHVLMLWIAAALVFFIGLAARSTTAPVPRGIGNAVEAMIVYMRDQIVRPYLGEYGDTYLPYFVTLFLFILFCNLLGLVPYGATATGNIAVTGSLALLTFAMISFTGIRHHGVIHYLKSYVPAGLPWFMVPIIFPIELIGIFTKSFALCIRLFANMLGGHIAILAFMSLIFLFHNMFVAVGSVVVLVALSLLELFVAFLQAYIFTMLTAVFVGGAVNPQH
jgi:F-type H+-transporting ATPase subunit a